MEFIAVVRGVMTQSEENEDLICMDGNIQIKVAKVRRSKIITLRCCHKCIDLSKRKSTNLCHWFIVEDMLDIISLSRSCNCFFFTRKNAHHDQEVILVVKVSSSEKFDYNESAKKKSRPNENP